MVRGDNMKPIICAYLGHDASFTIYHPEREMFYVLHMDRFSNVKHFNGFGHWEPDHPHPKWAFNRIADPKVKAHQDHLKRGMVEMHPEDFFMEIHRHIKDLWDIDNDYSWFIHKHRSNSRKPDVWNWLISHPNGFKWENHEYCGNYRFVDPLYDMESGFSRFTMTHHDWHAYNGFYQSPFEKAVVFSLDGGGDDTQCQWVVMDRTYQILEKDIYREFSCGVCYTYLGTKMNTFRHTTDQIIDLPGKLMGFSAYAPRNPWLNALSENILRHGMHFYPARKKDKYHDTSQSDINFLPTFDGVNDRIKNQRDSRYFRIMTEFSRMYGREVNDMKRHGFSGKEEKDICAATQMALEKFYYYMVLDVLMPKIKENDNNLVLTGGCALNVLAVQMLQREFPEVNIHVARDCEDGGLSFGGVVGWMANNGIVPKKNMPIITPRLLDYDDVPEYIEKHEATEVGIPMLARLLREGNIVGLVQGNIERGPRALGFRSILCDPQYPNMKEEINKKVKKREPYRPFAPACREEDAEKYFEVDRLDEVLHTMSTVVTVREEHRANLSVITHFDGTARLQTVTSESNPMFYELLTEFDGVLLNTSFNLQGKPILNKAEHALQMLYTTNLDYVVIEHDGKYWLFS